MPKMSNLGSFSLPSESDSKGPENPIKLDTGSDAITDGKPKSIGLRDNYECQDECSMAGQTQFLIEAGSEINNN